MAEPGLTPLEVASGAAFGCGPPSRRRAAETTPLAALEAAIEPALRRSPCLIRFSGGFDSSLVLAVATRVARRRGLADPVPITWRFADAPKAQESEWQERVVAELGLREWDRLSAGEQLDLVGPVARRVLARHGLLFPANAFLHEPLLARAAGGALLTGLGGDQILGRWRGRAIADLLAGRRGVSRRDARRLARVGAPVPVREVVERRRAPGWSWLTEAARREATGLLARELASEPAGWERHLRWQLSRRDLALAGAALGLLAQDSGAAIFHPLLEPSFVVALGRAGGRLGFGNRTQTIQAGLGDVLPRALLARRSKAWFDEVFWRDEPRALTSAWDGRTLDGELVDRDALRVAWASERPDARTSLLLHQLWLGTRKSSGQPAAVNGLVGGCRVLTTLDAADAAGIELPRRHEPAASYQRQPSGESDSEVKNLRARDCGVRRSWPSEERTTEIPSGAQPVTADLASRTAPYEPPRVTRLGTLAELTRGSTGAFQDAAMGNQDGGGTGSGI